MNPHPPTPPHHEPGEHGEARSAEDTQTKAKANGGDSGGGVIGSQAKRRTFYGLNVLVAVLAAVVIAVLLNVIMFWQYENLPPGARQWVRYDLTQTRRHSLAPQTRKVLGQLDGKHTIVGWFRLNTERLRRIDDLLEQYDQYGANINTRHIGRDMDQQGQDWFLSEVEKRFDEQLQPAKQAVQSGVETLPELARAFGEIETKTRAVLDDKSIQGQQVLGQLRTIVTNSGQLNELLNNQAQQIDKTRNQPLPNYTTLIQGGTLTQGLQSLLSQSEQFLGQVNTAINKLVDQSDLPGHAKEQLLAAAERAKQAQSAAKPALNKIKLVEPVEGYDRIVSMLNSQPAVAVLGPKQVRVIPISAMYRRQSQQHAGQSEQDESSQPPFIGEERLTGALVSMNLDHPPLVVFMMASPTQALGRQGQFNYVAQRLQAANFEVKQWNATGRRMAMGQRMPPGELPTPAKGQRAVYVVAPFFPTKNQRAGMNQASGSPKQKVVDALRKRLAAGDSAMIMLMPDFAAQFGQANPILPLLHHWGMFPQLDRVILREVARGERQTQAITAMTVSRWPQQLPVTRVLAGQPTMFQMPSPMTLKPKKAKDTKLYPLVKVREDRMWSRKGSSSAQKIRQSKYDPEAGRDSFLVAAAAERDTSRLIAIADPSVALDQITTYGSSMMGRGPGAAQQAGGVAQFPGNTQLFTNSVFWLAHMDQMIAAGARTQDIRRLGEITPDEQTVFYIVLLAGLPLIAVGGGIGVWLVRRRA